MPFTLSSLPTDALHTLFHTFWESRAPSQIHLRLQQQNESDWQMDWSSGDLRAEPEPTREHSTFTIGDLTGQLQLISVPSHCSEQPAPHDLTVFTALVRQALDSLIQRWQVQASHDQLTAVMQATPLAVYAVTLEGLLKYWNAAARETLHILHHSEVGQKIGDPELEAAFATLRKNLARGRPLKPQQIEQRQADGSARILELKAAPLSEGTELVGLVGVVREVSSAEQRLAFAEQQRSLLESVLAFANDSVLITEAEPIEAPDGPRILYANEAFTRTTGYLPEEVLGKTPRILQGAQTDRQALDRLKAALKAWQPVEVELINYRKDGTPFWVELSIAPVANARGWYTHWISIQRDITDRKTSALQQEKERNEVLELAARNVPLPEVLIKLSSGLERQWPNHVVAFVLSTPTKSELYVDRVGRAHPWERSGVAQRLLQSSDGAPPSHWAQQTAGQAGGRRPGRLRLLEGSGVGSSP